MPKYKPLLIIGYLSWILPLLVGGFAFYKWRQQLLEHAVNSKELFKSANSIAGYSIVLSLIGIFVLVVYAYENTSRQRLFALFGIFLILSNVEVLLRVNKEKNRLLTLKVFRVHNSSNVELNNVRVSLPSVEINNGSILPNCYTVFAIYSPHNHSSDSLPNPYFTLSFQEGISGKEVNYPMNDSIDVSERSIVVDGSFQIQISDHFPEKN